MAERIRRAYARLAAGQQLHYRQAGHGRPVLLLHPSPLSSAFFEPLINCLSDEFCLYALDTPGYGASDPLADPGEDLSAYVDVIDEFLELLNLSEVLVYGSATGAQLAIESAKACPHSIAGLVLENAAAFSDDERERIIGRYFPDISPHADGSHLPLAWRMASQTFQFFPWYDTRESARISQAEPPLPLVQASALACLGAGEDYARAYKAAFANERPQQLAAVEQSVRVMLWQDSPLLAYSRRLQAADMPANIEFIDVASGIEARYAALRAALHSFQ